MNRMDSEMLATQLWVKARMIMAGPGFVPAAPGLEGQAQALAPDAYPHVQQESTGSFPDPDVPIAVQGYFRPPPPMINKIGWDSSGSAAQIPMRR